MNTDQGYKDSIVDILNRVWVYKYSDLKHLPPSTANTCQAMIEGYAQDRYLFEKMGLKGLPGTDKGFGTWSELVKYRTLGSKGPHALADAIEEYKRTGKKAWDK